MNSISPVQDFAELWKLSQQPKRGAIHFEAKYLEGCEYDIPADLPDEVTRQVQDYACRTFTALDCAGLARVDFFVTPGHDVL